MQGCTHTLKDEGQAPHAGFGMRALCWSSGWTQNVSEATLRLRLCEDKRVKWGETKGGRSKICLEITETMACKLL